MAARAGGARMLRCAVLTRARRRALAPTRKQLQGYSYIAASNRMRQRTYRVGAHVRCAGQLGLVLGLGGTLRGIVSAPRVHGMPRAHAWRRWGPPSS